MTRRAKSILYKGKSYDEARKRIVRIWGDDFEPNFDEEVEPNTYRRRHVQRGHIRMGRAIVTVVRKHLDAGWTSWIEMSRMEEARPVPRGILPTMTPAEQDAWADYAFTCVSREAGITLWEMSRYLPGWDDTQTFEPRRLPYEGKYLWPAPCEGVAAWEPFGGYVLVTHRALALAGMALRRLVRQGRAHKIDSESRWVRQ